MTDKTNQTIQAPRMDATSPYEGKTYVADGVIATIARIAAEQVEGVHKIGVSGLRGLLGRVGGSSGVDAESGLKEAAVALDVIVEFGYPIRQVTRELRRRVIADVERLASRQVVAVDINVVDIHVGEIERRQTRELE